MKLNLFSILTILILFSCVNESKDKGTTLKSEFVWEYASPESQGLSSSKLKNAVDLLVSKNTRKLLIIRHDKIVYEWYAEGFEDSVRTHYTASLAKSIIGGMALLTAMNDGYIKADDLASQYIPSWAHDDLKSRITIRHLATHSSGMENSSVTEVERRKMIELGLHTHRDLPGWKGQFWRLEPDPFIMARDSAPILYPPGTRFEYSNPGAAMLAYAVTVSLKNSVYNNIQTYLRDKVFEPIGIKENEYSMGYKKTFPLEGLQLVPSWGGADFTANAVARIGRLMLKKGNWQGIQLIDSSFVEEVIIYRGTPLSDAHRFETDPLTSEKKQIDFSPATTLGWWSNYDQVWKNLPPDAFCGAGAENQVLLVIPSLDLIVVRFGGNLFSTAKGENFWLGIEKYLFNPVMEAIEDHIVKSDN